MANVVDGADMRMIEAGDGASLALESLAQIGAVRHVVRQYLDRDGALQPRVPGLVNLTHPSRTQRRFNLVGSEFHAQGEGHNRGL